MEYSVESYISFLNDYDDDGDCGFEEASEGIKDFAAKVDGGVKKIPLIGKVYGLLSKLFGAVIGAFRGLIDKIRGKKNAGAEAEAGGETAAASKFANDPEKAKRAQRDTNRLAKAAAVTPPVLKQIKAAVNEVAVSLTVKLNPLKVAMKAAMEQSKSDEDSQKMIDEINVIVNRVTSLEESCTEALKDVKGQIGIPESTFSLFEKGAAKILKSAESFKADVDAMAKKATQMYSTTVYPERHSRVGAIAGAARNIGTAMNKFASWLSGILGRSVVVAG